MDKLRLVIVENDEDEQMFMREAFEQSDYFELVDMLDNGKELIRWIETPGNATPDMILSDLNMPGKSGIDIIRYIKNNPLYAKILVVITSTSSTKSIADNCLKEGADHYLVKPESLLGYKAYIDTLVKQLRDAGSLDR